MIPQPKKRLIRLPHEPLGRMRQAEMPTIYAIYENPVDQPGCYVVRAWVWSPNDGRYVAGAGLGMTGRIEDARKLLPPGLVRLKEREGNGSSIVETWI